jgi:hypothetical protein
MIPSQVLNGATVNVGPTPTILVPVTRTARVRGLMMTIQQLTAGQTVDAVVQVGPTENGPWDPWDQSTWAGIDDSIPRSRTASTVKALWLRVLATQSGIGGNVLVWAHLVDEETP